MSLNTLWWQNGIIYQIYPRSFQNTTGKGIGDLPGITQRLDYLQWLGIDAIWISPIYPSPMADFGYDVSNYTDIDPMFGQIADMDALIEAAHARGLRVILDFVVNHSSDQHPWFIESRSSRDNPKRDWYIWRDPIPDGTPPNNWLSQFDRKSAWKWDDQTSQYYLHTFLTEQPDLNWRNPEVRTAMLNVMRFWFERDIDGFRVDAPHHVMKDVQFRDNPPNPDWHNGMVPAKQVKEIYTINTTDSHNFNRWLREVADEYKDKVLIGEIILELEKLVMHYGHHNEVHLPCNFSLISFTPWEATSVRNTADRYEELLPDGAWPNWVLSNHDRHRFASRVGERQARVGMMLLLTLRGTPTMYYGEEIGMHDVEIPPECVQDPFEINVPGLGFGRDPARTPMQWDNTPNAGFCLPNVKPWLPVASDYQKINVAVERDNHDSMLSLTHALIKLRRTTAALSSGDYRSFETPDGVFAFLRQQEEQQVLVALNFTDQPKRWTLPKEVGQAKIFLSTHRDREGDEVGETLELRSDEGVIFSA